MERKKATAIAKTKSLSSLSLNEDGLTNQRLQNRFEKEISRNKNDYHSLFERSNESDEDDVSAEFYTEMVESGWSRQQLSA
ncbi:MAG: hypothetical protein ABIO57_02750 [Candidatus Paceibacterota bacterium]